MRTRVSRERIADVDRSVRHDHEGGCEQHLADEHRLVATDDRVDGELADPDLP